MNLAHIHIVLNHIPSLGSVAGFILLAAALFKKNNLLLKQSLQLLVLVALAVLPTYISGAEAQRFVPNQDDTVRAMIQVHQNGAMVALLAMTITGTLAWFGLWEIRRFTRAGFLTSWGTLLATLVTVVFILNTGGLGGKISHPEVRDGADYGVTVADGWREPIELFISDKAWTWPAAETVHFIGMTLLFGVSLLLLMRMLGMVKSIPFKAIHRLLPLGIIGFVANVLTGMLFFVAGPGNYLGKNGFHMKMAGILIAAIPLLYFTMSDEPWRVDGNQNASATSKVAAISTFVLLVVVIIYGRYLPFLL